MKIEISPNKLCKEHQEIDFTDHVLTLIGENGCGKSSILEAIFEKSLHENNKKTVVCFSSGQNESFSKPYFSHIKNSRNIIRIKDEESLLALDDIKTFYFDYNWSKFLIFFASILKKDGRAHSFLNDKYIDVNDSNDDITSTLSFQIEVSKVYVNRISEALKIEESDALIPTLRKSIFHNQLSKLIELKIDPIYEFDKILKRTIIKISGTDVISIFGKDSSSIFQFLSIASIDNYFLNIEESELKFKNDFTLNNLSDGEYQLLVIFSLIDLFDSDNTLFLFDEIDSHLHYRNLEKLWEILISKIKGNLITTSHIADSIVLNNLDSIKLINSGRVDNDGKLNDLLERLDKLTNRDDKKKKIASKVEYLALVEDKTDWIIFTELAKKRLGESYESLKMEKIHIVKCSGGYDKEGDDFGGSKKQWVKDFSKCSDISTKEIFLICDRDVLPIGNMLPLTDPKAIKIPMCQVEIIGNPSRNLPKTGNGNKYPCLLSWRRREIENYLFTNSVLSSFDLLTQVNQKLGDDSVPRTEQTMDGNESIRDKDLKTLLASILYKPKEENIYDIGRWNYEMLYTVLECIPASEISDDIVNMYTFIVSKIN